MEEIIEIEQEKVLDSPETIIRLNIDKANRLLDAALNEVLSEPSGDLDDIMSIASVDKLNSRRIEVISRLIDSITTAAEKLITAENEGLGLLLRQDMLKLKEKELELKGERVPVSLNQQFTQTNVIIKTREELLKLMHEDPSIIDVEEITNIT